jgi:hypothetical protein
MKPREYQGVIHNDKSVVTVRELPAGKPLRVSPRLDLCNHSPTGLSWGYGGSGPAQTALAILADFLVALARAEDKAMVELAVKASGKFNLPVFWECPEPLTLQEGAEAAALALHQKFKGDFVARWPMDGAWTLTGDQIKEWLGSRLAERATSKAKEEPAT